MEIYDYAIDTILFCFIEDSMAFECERKLGEFW
mgnify:CR=1 FL=1